MFPFLVFSLPSPVSETQCRLLFLFSFFHQQSNYATSFLSVCTQDVRMAVPNKPTFSCSQFSFPLSFYISNNIHAIKYALFPTLTSIFTIFLSLLHFIFFSFTIHFFIVFIFLCSLFLFSLFSVLFTSFITYFYFFFIHSYSFFIFLLFASLLTFLSFYFNLSYFHHFMLVSFFLSFQLLFCLTHFLLCRVREKCTYLTSFYILKIFFFLNSFAISISSFSFSSYVFHELCALI
ncbi:unnamed protein product [Acanthosepion pharaonis]|uniref:Uncharacterized protein n=1 Tax=Acanthosepion pharaonis TaxID=158019 RepID=A0A812EDP8_ACAPH|nr:unnamed protein product [Sepia pharaonis]